MTPPLLISQAKAVLGRKLGPLVGLADLDDALRTSLGYLGITTADPVVPVDADLLTITLAGQITQLYDVAIWRGLQTMLMNATADDLVRMGVAESLDDISTLLRNREERMREFVKSAYQIGLPTLSAGVVTIAADVECDNEFGRPCR